MKNCFRTRKTGESVQDYICRECNRKRHQYWYRQSPEHKEKQYLLNYRYRIEHPEKYAFMMAKHWAKKIGYKLVKNAIK